jgi:23S rRNA pseudouridine2457 synthase
LSQFTPEAGNKCLADYFDVPRRVYPVGRLDLDSEGLLILTHDKKLNALLLNPKHQHQRTYWVEVEGIPTSESLSALEKGVLININGKKYKTKPCRVKIIQPVISERDPPVNYLKHPQRTWLSITLTEGKNRQVRRMTAKIGHPTLRLIRTSIEHLQLDHLEPGMMIKLSKNAIYSKLKIPSSSA